MGPQFQKLADALSNERTALSADEPGTDPELVVVFDLVGSVDGFLRAVRDVEGLDFLADLVGEDAEPDDDFFQADKSGERTDKALRESLYMVMTNEGAVEEIVRLFDRWVDDPAAPFATGMAPLKDVFANLRSVRRWGPQDRVREVGLLNVWEETLKTVGLSGSARVEVELWYRNDPSHRAAAEAHVRNVITEGGGTVLRSIDLEDIRYHALLADIPHHEVETVLDRGPEAIALLTTDAVMFVAPTVPMAIDSPAPSSRTVTPFYLATTGLPRVALLDGLPLTGHNALAGRLIVDDPDDMTARYGAAPRGHGTSMASLICHGDLATSQLALTAPLYVRPVMQPNEIVSTQETTPPDEFLVDLIHRCFVRMFEGDGASPPSAPSVRIVNLSIGDPAREFARQLSPLARLLDWLAHKYNQVIVVSGGNHRMEVAASSDEIVGDLSDARSVVAKRLRDRSAVRRLLSPGEAVNALTVGSVHADESNQTLPDTVIDLLDEGSPASYSPVGSGYRRSVKPDVLMPGGRQVHTRPPPGADVTKLHPAPTESVGPGLLSAGPGPLGSLDSTVFTCGTSNSAALATRHLDLILEALADPNSEDGLPLFPDAQYHPVLGKAMLVHATSWGDAGQTLKRQLGLDGAGVRDDDARKELVKLLGYGPVDVGRILVADRIRAVLVGAGSIRDGERQTFRYPLPPSLIATKLRRRLTLTLAWISPVNPRSQKYRMARLLLSPPTDELSLARIDVPFNTPGRGTVHHEILESEKAVVFQSGDALEINVDCRVDAGKLERAVRFGVVVSLEIAGGTLIDLHQEVESQVRAEVRQPVRTRTSPQS